MRRTTEEIKSLLTRWYEGQTTCDEEQELREWFRTTDDVPAELEAERRIFCGFESLASQTVQPRPMCSVGAVRWRLAARIATWGVAAALIVGAVFAVEYARRPYGYINGEPVRDAEVAMQTMVYLEQLSEFDCSVESLDEIMKITEK